MLFRIHLHAPLIVDYMLIAQTIKRIIVIEAVQMTFRFRLATYSKSVKIFSSDTFLSFHKTTNSILPPFPPFTNKYRMNR